MCRYRGDITLCTSAAALGGGLLLLSRARGHVCELRPPRNDRRPSIVTHPMGGVARGFDRGRLGSPITSVLSGLGRRHALRTSPSTTPAWVAHMALE